MNIKFFKKLDESGELFFLDERIIIYSHKSFYSNDLERSEVLSSKYFYVYNLQDFKIYSSKTLLNADWLSSNFDILDNKYICYIDNYKNSICLVELDTLTLNKEINKETIDFFYIIKVYNKSNIAIFEDSSEYGEIRLINVDDNSIKTFISNEKLDRGANDIVCLPSKGLILSTHNEYINIWSVESKNIIKRLKHCSTSLAISFDNKFLASASLENSEDIYIYNIDTWEHIKTLNGMDQDQKNWAGHHYCEYVCFSPNGKYLAVTYFQKIKIFDFETGEVVYRSFSASSYISFSKDNKYIYFNDGDGLKLFEFCFP